MTGIIYELTSAIINDCGKELVVYGIRGIENGNEILNYPYVCTDRQRLCEIISLCNRCKALPVHIPEILGDLGCTFA